MRRVLALVGGRAQPHVLLLVRGNLALDLGHLHPLVVARVLDDEEREDSHEAEPRRRLDLCANQPVSRVHPTILH